MKKITSITLTSHAKLIPASNKPSHAFEAYSEVEENKETIEKEAEKSKVNPDMVKAIVHLETTQGWYDRINPVKKTIRPMNVHTEYWKDLGFSRKALKDPEKNIQVGVELLKRIKEHMPDATDAEIATLYNSLGARVINDYGARVEKLMKEKPWEKKDAKNK